MSYETEKINGIEVVVLYRPTGQKEYELVESSEFKEWPPRLPEQPIFYPVLNEAYANEIAQKWNTKDIENGNIGYVTKFKVKKCFLDKYEKQVVGASCHAELWIPAEELEQLNQNIVGEIEVLSVFKD